MEALITQVGSAVAVLLVVLTGQQSGLPSVAGLKVPDYRVRQAGSSCWAYKWCIGPQPALPSPNMHSRWCSFLFAAAQLCLSHVPSEVLNWTVRLHRRQLHICSGTPSLQGDAKKLVDDVGAFNPSLFVAASVRGSL